MRLRLAITSHSHHLCRAIIVMPVSVLKVCLRAVITLGRRTRLAKSFSVRLLFEGGVSLFLHSCPSLGKRGAPTVCHTSWRVVAPWSRHRCRRSSQLFRDHKDVFLCRGDTRAAVSGTNGRLVMCKMFCLDKKKLSFLFFCSRLVYDELLTGEQADRVRASKE